MTNNKTDSITAAATARALKKNSRVANITNNLLRNYSKRPVSPMDEIDQLMTARRRTVSPPTSFAFINREKNLQDKK